LIVLLPGPDTLVVVRGIVRGGRSRGLATTVGILCGLAIWVAAAAFGLAALLRASRLGFDLLRFAGAAYLIWMGVQSLLLRRSVTGAEAPTAPRRGLLGSGFTAGLLTDLLNPKVGVFFITFLPAFVPTGYPVGATSAILGAIFIVETAAYFAVLIALASRVTRWMNTPRVRRRLDAATGAVLVVFGLRLATEA
jgi:RhtB (resistance to homoserine/threonine) family protein